jgi:hypothetical protein
MTAVEKPSDYFTDSLSETVRKGSRVAAEVYILGPQST